MNKTIKFPNITVQLTGKDGNAFNVLGIVTNELRKNNISENDINEFLNEAMSGDYKNLLATCMKWVNVK